MNRVTTLSLATASLLFLGFALPCSQAIGQQAGPTFHRYLVRAVLTAEGLKNLQKQPPTALKAGVAKFVESVASKPRGICTQLGGSCGDFIGVVDNRVGGGRAVIKIPKFELRNFGREDATPYQRGSNASLLGRV